MDKSSKKVKQLERDLAALDRVITAYQPVIQELTKTRNEARKHKEHYDLVERDAITAIKEKSAEQQIKVDERNFLAGKLAAIKESIDEILEEDGPTEEGKIEA